MITLPPQNNTDILMWDTWMSAFHLPTVTVADEIGLFNFLNEKNINIDLLSARLNLKKSGIEIVINVLVGLGFLIKKRQLIGLTPTSRNYLLPDSIFYWGPQLIGMRNRPEHRRILDALINSSAQLAFSNDTFSNMWESGALSNDAARDFTQKMHATIFAPVLGAVDKGVFSKTKKLLDMGGGSGCFSIAYVNYYPERYSAVFDLPAVCNVTRDYLKNFNLEDKIDIISGNFFIDEWPIDFDGILFSQIFHDWPYDYCKKLAKSAYDSLPKGGRIYIHEMLLDNDGSNPLSVACFNLLMFINHQSQQFTKNSLFELLRSVGFKRMKSTNTFGYYSVVEAEK